MLLRLAALCTIASTAALAGCATGNGSFKPDGFHHDDLPYTIRYDDAEARSFLGPDWRIDNYVVDAKGRPGQAKTADDYRGKITVDVDGDGKPEKSEVYYFDLKLANRKTSGIIWLQTIPLPQDESDRELRVLLNDYVESLSGSGFYATVAHPKEVHAQTYAAKVVSAKDTHVGPFRGYDATIELANVDRLKLDPSSRSGIVRVVLVHTDWQTRLPNHDGHPLSVLLRVGYEASPEDFEAGLPEFDRFLHLLELRHRDGATDTTPDE